MIVINTLNSLITYLLLRKIVKTKEEVEKKRCYWLALYLIES